MREAYGPMTCADITKAVMAARDVDLGLYPLHSRRTSRARYSLRARGLIVSQRTDKSGDLKWQIAH